MANNNSDPLFLVIKSLTKAEKRYFKLYSNKQKNTEDAKFIKLFDHIDKQTNYDESKILEKEPAIKDTQLSNLKAHLYKQILVSLRSFNSENDIDIKIREHIDYVTLLYNKCLYQQSIKMLEKVKQMALQYDKAQLLYQILDIEKKLVSRFIKSNIEPKVAELITEIEETRQKLNNIATFSNLSLKLYSFYLKIGFIRNQQDFELVNNFLYSTLPVFREDLLSFDEKNHLYNSLTGYYFFIQDFDRGYSYAKKWVDLFDSEAQYIVPKIEMYIRAINNLLMAQSKLFLYNEFSLTTQKFEDIRLIKDLNITLNIDLLLFKYASTHKINKFFMVGNFSEGVKIIPEINNGLNQHADHLDTHFTTIFYYKFACMYFGNAQYSESIFWLNQIINAKDVDLRSDIHSFARILSLISHYELGNLELIEYHIRSTYRFLLKKENMSQYVQRMLRFLKKLSIITPDQLNEALSELRDQLKPLTNKPYEKRLFIYFDIISWLDSKLSGRCIKDIIAEKALKKIKAVEI